MYLISRQTLKQTRLWVAAAAVVLLLTSMIEAGHAHGVFADVDNHCALCQHSVALDKTLLRTVPLVSPLLLIALAVIFYTRKTAKPSFHFANIRAPPQTLHRR